MPCSPLESLYQARDNILRQIIAISESTLGNNYTYDIEGQSVTVGADTSVQNMANLQKQLETINNLINMYSPFEIHSVTSEP